MDIALVEADDFSIWHLHRRLLKTLIEKGFNVYVISTKGEYVKLIESLGVTHIPVHMERFISPLKDLKLLMELNKIFRYHNFDIVHNFTIKPNIYGSIAAKMAGINKIIGTVEGLGFTYTGESGLKIKLIRPLVNALYKMSCRFSHRFWFVNPDDLALFTDRNILPPQKAFLTISAGVNLKEYQSNIDDNERIVKLKKELNINGSKIVTMVTSRIVWSKGVREFIEAARIVRNRYPSVKFLLLGAIEKDSPQSISERYLRKKEKSGNFQWLGFRKDVKAIYALSDIVVLPSYYREGVPNVLLEAMAMGKPIVTTNNVGCREVVEEGKNGYLVSVKNSNALTDALSKLIIDKKKCAEFGQYSRKKAEIEFDEELVVNRIMKELYRFS